MNVKINQIALNYCIVSGFYMTKQDFFGVFIFSFWLHQ